MRDVKKVILAATIITALGLSTAYAATEDTENTHKMRDLVARTKLEEEVAKRPAPYWGHGPQQRRGQNMRMKLLAQVLGQEEKTVAKACFEQKLLPAQYADKNGKYAEYKAKRLEYAKSRLDKTVAEGKMTQAKADEAMQRITANLERERQGQRPIPYFVKDLALIVGKDEITVAKELQEKKLLPAQYADKNGKYTEYKAKRLTIAKERLAKGVTNGKMTQAKADEAMQRIEKNLELERQGKRPQMPQSKIVGPERDVFGPHNPDGSIAQGGEGMAYREHPLYGRMPFDTLAKLTGKTSQELYAQAYSEKKTAAALAKTLNVFAEYKAERLAAHQTLMDKAVAAGKMTQEQEDTRLAELGKKLEAGQSEFNRPGPRPGFSPMHPGPQVPPDQAK